MNFRRYVDVNHPQEGSYLHELLQKKKIFYVGIVLQFLLNCVLMMFDLIFIGLRKEQ